MYTRVTNPFSLFFSSWDGLSVLVMQPPAVTSPQKCRVKKLEKDVEI